MKRLLILVVFLPLINFGQKINAVKIDSLVSYYSNSPKILVVNFWSTWCKPCIEEIPGFIKVADSYKKQNVDLLLVSQDTKDLYSSGKLAAFVKAKHWQANIVWLSETDANYYCPKVDSTWTGAIPATVIANPAKGYKKFYEDSLSEAELAAEIKKAL